MIEFKIELDENVVQALGREQIEDYLKTVARRIALKAAAKDILSELSEIDLQNDKEWQVARELAWQQEKHNYLAKTRRDGFCD